MEDTGGTGGSGDSGQGGAWAGNGGTGADTGGTQATGGFGQAGSGQGGIGGFAGTPPMCTDFAPPQIYACAYGDALQTTESGRVTLHADLTGEVEPASSGTATCDTNVHLGNAMASMQRYSIANDETELELSLGAPTGMPILKDLPFGVYAELGSYTCTTDSACGETDSGGTVIVGDDDSEIALGSGERGDLRDYSVFVVSNSTFTKNDMCLETESYHNIALAFVPRGSLSSCYGRSESTCATEPGCKAVRAYFGADTSPSFVTCVEEDSCGDGDATVCAIHGVTEELALFTTTCIPPGWVAYGNADCARGDEDAGAP